MDISPIQPQGKDTNNLSGTPPPPGNEPPPATQESATPSPINPPEPANQPITIDPSGSLEQNQSADSVVQSDVTVETPKPFVMDDASSQGISDTSEPQENVQTAESKPLAPGDQSVPPEVPPAVQPIQPAVPMDNSQNTVAQTPPAVAPPSAGIASVTPSPESINQPAPAQNAVTPPQQPAQNQLNDVPTGTIAPAQQAASVSQPGVVSPQQAASVSQPGVVSPQQAAVSQATTELPKPNNRRKLPFILGGAAVLVLATVAVVFGYIVPNRPENVFSTGMDRTGSAMNELIFQATEPESIEALRKMEAAASMNLEMEGQEFSGNARFRLDGDSTESTFEIKSTGDDGMSLSADVLTSIPEGSDFPNVYFQVTGITELGVDEFLPGINRYDGRWIHIPSQLIDDALGSSLQATESQQGPGTEDYASLIRSISESVDEYVFTSDEDKQIFALREVVGSEEVKGHDTYRYAVDVQQPQVEAFCRSLLEKIETSDYYESIVGSDFSATSDTSECDDAAEELSDVDIEMWVDKRTKLISKMRFSDKDATDQYLEFGQVFNGGDEIEFFVKSVDGDDTSEMKLRTNTDSYRSEADILSDVTGANGYKLEVQVSMEPYDQEVVTTPPESAVSIEDMINDLSGGGFTLGQQTDTESGIASRLPGTSGSSELLPANLDEAINTSDGLTLSNTSEVQLPSLREVIRNYSDLPSPSQR